MARSCDIPDCFDRRALEGDSNGKGYSVANHPSDGYLCDEAESFVEENTEVKKENGEFGKGLHDDVEDLGYVVELLLVSGCPEILHENVPSEGRECFRVGRPRNVSQSRAWNLNVSASP